MKHIIVEGTDRVGKNTLINFLCSKTQNYCVRHFGKPLGLSNEERIRYQKQDFLNEFRLSLLTCKDTNFERTPEDLYIWNRSHIGEWVYGKMYRNYHPTWIWEEEQKFLFDKTDTYLILLYGEPDFLIKREDGNSLSAKLEDRECEINLFHEAFDMSIIPNKLKICINKGDSYVPIDVIRKKTIKFLNI